MAEELNRPDKPIKVDPFESIQAIARVLRNSILNDSKPENAQQTLCKLDDILKNIAQLQKSVGALRTESGQHVQSLRQANPKGKPAEGTVREVKGRSLIFLDGFWQPLKVIQETEEVD